MILPRVIPCLLMRDGGLWKGQRFQKLRYVGDPLNAIRIFNRKEVDELCVLDISATAAGRQPDFERVEQSASECFMPLCYGGGVISLEQMHRLFSPGVEKVCLGTAAWSVPGLLEEASATFGSQSVLACVEVARTLSGRWICTVRNGRKRIGLGPAEYARRLQDSGVGEILLNDVSNDGRMAGFDLELVRAVSEAVDIPVMACGGAGQLEDLHEAVRAGASAAVAGSFFVFHGSQRGVLISYPQRDRIDRLFGVEVGS